MRSGRRWRLGLVTLLVASVALAADRPPKNLRLVGDHWTPWDPPTSFPEGADVYVIQKGDTLWDLAGSRYGDPYLWPQLWERNRYILDAHWIYPGDPLVMGIEATPIEEIAAAEEAAAGAGPPAGEAEEGLRLDRGVGPPVPLGTESDIYCSGYIGDLDERFERRVVGSEYENLAPRLSASERPRGRYGGVDTVKMDLSTGDIVYVDGGRRAGLLPGSLFTAVEPRDKVVHPVSGEVVGRMYRYLGRVRVLSVQEETGIAEIVHSCDPIHIGARLRPFEPQPVPLARRHALQGVNDPPPDSTLESAPVILRSVMGLVSIGQDHVVFIDRGADDDVTPGDVFVIYRPNRPGIPPVVIGEVGVLAVDSRTAVAKVLESRYSVHVGDRLGPKTP